MNINELGQLFITGIEGTSLSDDEKTFLEENNIGGVILFDKNFESPAQLAELVNQIQTCRDEYPLFISVDQEGGRVRRFKTSFFQSPSMFEVAKHDSPKLTFEVHKLIADQLRECGVNLNFAPVCDIWSNPKNNVIGDRAFGTTPDVVEKHVSAAIRGIQTAKIISCAKHFPGHGDTIKDSHNELPFVVKPLAEIESFELLPFQKAAKSRVEMMMMAHLVIDELDKENPATLSKACYDYLRKILKFNRVVITDDMEMGAVTTGLGVEEACVKALNAGADIILYRNTQTCKSAYLAARKATKDKELKLPDLEDKIKRVMDLKKSYFSEYNPIYIPDIDKNMQNQKAQELQSKLTTE